MIKANDVFELAGGDHKLYKALEEALRTCGYIYWTATDSWDTREAWESGPYARNWRRPYQG